jgi:hypothetical protein
MSKAKLEFDLTDFDDRMEFERATRSTDMAMVLWEMFYNTKKIFLDSKFFHCSNPLRNMKIKI